MELVVVVVVKVVCTIYTYMYLMILVHYGGEKLLSSPQIHDFVLTFYTIPHRSFIFISRLWLKLWDLQPAS